MDVIGNSKFTFEERMRIGKEIYEKKLNIYSAAVKYEISSYTARDYFRMYKNRLHYFGEEGDGDM